MGTEPAPPSWSVTLASALPGGLESPLGTLHLLPPERPPCRLRPSSGLLWTQNRNRTLRAPRGPASLSGVPEAVPSAESSVATQQTLKVNSWRKGANVHSPVPALSYVSARDHRLPVLASRCSAEGEEGEMDKICPRAGSRTPSAADPEVPGQLSKAPMSPPEPPVATGLGQPLGLDTDTHRRPKA